MRNPRPTSNPFSGVDEDGLRELAPEKRLEDLDPEFIEAWLKQQRRHDH